MPVTSHAPAGRLQGRVVLITGGSRGVGAACALACAREGAAVVVSAKTVDRHPTLPGSLAEVVARIEAMGGQALAVPCDVRDAGQVDAMVQAAVDRFGRLDALVNNAGAIHWGPVADWSARRFDLVMGVNVRAAFLATRAALPHLRVHGGHVVMMSPPIHPTASPGKAPYLVSKIGMTMLAMAVDAEEVDVAACSLWPVTGVRTAATEVHGFGDAREWRTPEILADATVALLARDPRRSPFRAWLDEEVLAEVGLTDLSAYACVPGCEPTPMSITLVDPTWRR
ncbi:SDR family oxidoreductase [Myxococcota bacterium]|nr:SDR family oxidoreductase [Myxococcota bacterium]